jgi:hypothetical protein
MTERVGDLPVEIRKKTLGTLIRTFEHFTPERSAFLLGRLHSDPKRIGIEKVYFPKLESSKKSEFSTDHQAMIDAVNFGLVNGATIWGQAHSHRGYGPRPVKGKDYENQVNLQDVHNPNAFSLVMELEPTEDMEYVTENQPDLKIYKLVYGDRYFLMTLYRMKDGEPIDVELIRAD